VFFQDNMGLELGTVKITGGAGSGRPQPTPLCDGMVDPAQFSGAQISSYDVSAAYGTTAVMFALAGPRVDHTTELCVTIVSQTTTPGTFTVSSATMAGTPGDRAVLASLDSGVGGCPSVVLANQRYAATHVGSACQLASSPTPLADAGMMITGQPVGRVPLVPAIAGHGADALVYEVGIESFNQSTGNLESLYVSDRAGALSLSAFGDLDGDGKTDAVVASTGEADLDALYRLTSPKDGFLRLRIGTQDPVKLIAVGDFDGNGVGDVLAIESVTIPRPHDPMVIAFGTRDQLLPPTEVGELSDVLSLTTVKLIDSTDQTGVVDDVALIDRRDTSTVLGLLHGTPQRGLIPFLDPRAQTPPAWLTSGFTTVVGGHFLDGDPPNSVDLLAIDVSVVPTVRSQVWVMAGAGPGTVAPPPMRSAVEAIDANLCMAPSQTFCANGSWYQAGLFGDHEVVVGLDAINGAAVVIDPRLVTNIPGSMLKPTPNFVMPQLSTLTSMLVADSDGDGTNEVIFAYVAANGGGGVKSCTVSGATVDCSRDLFANEPALQGRCIAVAHGAMSLQGQTAGSGSAKQLVVVCDQTVYRLDHDDTGYHAVPLITLPSPPVGFALADVTGDAVADVLVTTFVGGAKTLLVYPQCTSRGCP
jgi:hypothetical protein